MQIPGTPSIFFLIYLVVLLPWMAFKSSRRLGTGATTPTTFTDLQLERIWYSTTLNLSLMFALAWAVGNGFGFRILKPPVLRADVLLVSLSAAAVCFLIRTIARHIQSSDERSRLIVFALAPRDKRQWILKGIVILCASVAEESAYRGVAWQILSYSLGNHLLAAFISGLAFSAAHWVQGWKSMVIIFLFAMIMHGLVWYTESLIPAMIVHGVYDIIAISLIAAEASSQRQMQMTSALTERQSQKS